MAVCLVPVLCAPTQAWCQPAPRAAAEGPLPAVPQMPKLTPDQQKQQVALLASLDGDQFPWPLIRAKANAPLWLDLAGAARPAPMVVAALARLTERVAPAMLNVKALETITV